ncbi:hypothetical protein [Flavobacterium fluviatile]|uniref:hypothetical protein n=1 Tax=Flavobacterium fluviatile TaxID=1862387 RepID=UPI0013D0FE20|nr:hypothetical protein [Flavobacterium fluviatile]
MALPNGAIIEKVYEIIDIGIGVIPALTDDNILLIYESLNLDKVSGQNSDLTGTKFIRILNSLLLHTGYGLIYFENNPATASEPNLYIGIRGNEPTNGIGLKFLSDRVVFVDTIREKGLEYDADFKENFTELSLVSKIYVDSRTVINETTTALTASDLNTAYPTATTGFKVQCKSISAGGLIYEKSAAGWIQYAIVTVT